MDATSLSRRSLLLGGAALAVTAPLLLRGDVGATEPNALERLAAQPGARIRLFHVDADPAQPFAMAAGATVIAARALRSGDRSLEGGGVRLHVAGLTPDGASVPQASLDALVVVPGASEVVPFYAFTHRPGATSGPVHLTTVASHRPSLGLMLEVAGSTSSSVLTTRRDAGLDRLRSGWYLVDLRPAGGPMPAQLPAPGDAAWNELPSLALSVVAA